MAFALTLNVTVVGEVVTGAGDLGMELADILFVLICIANREGIDLDQAFERMMAKVESRDRDRWTRKAATPNL